MLRDAIETLKAAMDDARARLPGEWTAYVPSERISTYGPWISYSASACAKYAIVWQQASDGVGVDKAIDAFIARTLAERADVAARKPTPDQLAATLGV